MLLLPPPPGGAACQPHCSSSCRAPPSTRRASPARCCWPYTRRCLPCRSSCCSRRRRCCRCWQCCRGPSGSRWLCRGREGGGSLSGSESKERRGHSGGTWLRRATPGEQASPQCYQETTTRLRAGARDANGSVRLCREGQEACRARGGQTIAGPGSGARTYAVAVPVGHPAPRVRRTARRCQQRSLWTGKHAQVRVNLSIRSTRPLPAAAANANCTCNWPFFERAAAPGLPFAHARLHTQHRCPCHLTRAICTPPALPPLLRAPTGSASWVLLGAPC